MSFCTNCGTELTEGAAFCSNCGAGQVHPIEAAEQPFPTPEPELAIAEPVCQELEAEQAVTVYPQTVYQPTESAPAAALTGPAKIFSIISMACGIASILLCCSGPTFGIAAIICSILGRKKTPAGVNNTMATVGLITGIIGAALGVIMLIVSFISGFINGYSGIEDSFNYMYCMF